MHVYQFWFVFSSFVFLYYHATCGHSQSGLVPWDYHVVLSVPVSIRIGFGRRFRCPLSVSPSDVGATFPSRVVSSWLMPGAAAAAAVFVVGAARGGGFRAGPRCPAPWLAVPGSVVRAMLLTLCLALVVWAGRSASSAGGRVGVDVSPQCCSSLSPNPHPYILLRHPHTNIQPSPQYHSLYIH